MGEIIAPKHVELTGFIKKPLLLHLFGSLYYLYQWCTVEQTSNCKRLQYFSHFLDDDPEFSWKHISLYAQRLHLFPDGICYHTVVHKCAVKIKRAECTGRTKIGKLLTKVH